MLSLTKFSLKNPAAIIILCVLLAGLGVFSFTTLKTDLLPDIEFPELSVTVVYPGASPQDVQEKITAVLEEQFGAVEGIESVTGQSFESLSRLQLAFPLDSDMEKVTVQVNELMNAAQLPDSITTRVDQFSFDALPVINLALFSKDQGTGIEAWAEEVLRPELQRIQGVSQVALSGMTNAYLDMQVNKELANQLGLSLSQIQEVIEAAFFSFPAGSVEEDSLLIPIRLEQKIETLDELKALTVLSPVRNEGVALDELVTFNEVTEQNEISRYNLQDALSLSIIKKQDINTVQVVEQVLETLNYYDDTIEYAVSFDQAAGIKSSIKGLIEKGLFGALFASLAVLLFLRNLRATMIAVLSIPLSLLIAAIFLKWWGVTLNVMSLAGMTVAVGRVVDDSIIVIENIYRKTKLDPNGDKKEHTILGTKEMLNPIISSTLTSIVVFLPLGLVGGITGAFFMPFALTVVVALLASLFVAITLVPILAKVSFIKLEEDHKDGWMVRLYEKLIKGALKYKALVCILAVLLLIPTLLLAQNLGFVFLPNETQKIVKADIQLPASTPVQETNQAVQRLEEYVIANKERYPNTFISIGSYDYMSGVTRSNQAELLIELASESKLELAIEELQAEFERILDDDNENTVVNVQELQTNGPPTNNNIDIDLFSNDMDKLAEAAQMVEELMLQRDDVKYVINNMEDKQQQWTVHLDAQRINELGVSPFMILGMVNEQLAPIELDSYTLDGTEQKLRIAYDRALEGKEELESLRFFTQEGLVQLNDLAEVREELTPTSIQSLNQRTFARVSAQIIGDDLFGVSGAVSEAVRQLDLPEGVSLESGGGSDETLQTIQDLIVAITIAVGLVYLTMLVFFGKARVPFIILTSILFVPIGSILALLLVNEPMSMSAMIGLLMLVGIVVTNAIVLVDRINQNRAAGMRMNDALVEAGKTRLRPILMTALATIAALLPLAFATPEGGLISKGLALVVIGGLTTSTLLTLIFVPVIYSLAFYKESKLER
ncbi:efflux RND transporter permease subunit [Bacillus horti]|uniref:HAE1 family hydrophobic/amphiphilic exporter-1 n=1 Tax=Caldalkalibacillus horti TaxID=77523 RepID=A0ABT9W047_9BACI|nr:efflux RND transporter permease subunit [Bacillus horti]MDQ0166627.1 HAE1 family hydrophobic/amphiphilic exporter-1 [Bacillus horti]